MDRINGAGHVDHMFVAEDVDTGRPPTEITDAWLNGVQEELMTVIQSAGIVPSIEILNQLLLALNALYLRRDGVNPMGGPVLLKAGAATPLNPSNCGLGFAGDSDTGIFSGADGTIQLASNGVPVLESTALGALIARKGMRAPKGAPGANDESALSGFSFASDGDTGLFAEGGADNAGSDLVLRIDGVVASRFRSSDVISSTVIDRKWFRSAEGWIIQFGQLTFTDDGSARAFTWTFPTSFPTGCMFVTPSLSSAIDAGAALSVEGWSFGAANGYHTGPAGSRSWMMFAFGC